MAITRHNLRIKAFELIFQSNLVDVNDVLAISKVDDAEYFENPYVESTVSGVWNNISDIDEIISAHLKTDWSLPRLSKVVLAVLRLGVYEIVYNSDVPSGAAINEAVEITKQYADEGEHSFVNGILGQILKDTSK